MLFPASISSMAVDPQPLGLEAPGLYIEGCSPPEMSHGVGQDNAVFIDGMPSSWLFRQRNFNI